MSVRRGVAAALGLTAASCALVVAGSKAPAPVRTSLFFTAALEGSLEPCGCSANMRGGIARSAEVLREARERGGSVFFIDSGSALFPSGQIPPAAVAEHERRAVAIAQALSRMGLTVRAPGSADDARGAAFREGLGLPELQPQSVRLLDVGPQRVAIVSAASVSAATALARTARRERAAFVVALVAESFEDARSQLEHAPDLDLVVASAPSSALSAEQDKQAAWGPTRLVQIASKGRSLVRVDLTLRGQGPISWLAGSSQRELDLLGLEKRIELLRAQVAEPGQSDALKELKQAKLVELIARRAALAAEPLPEPAEGDLATLRFIPIEGSLPEEPSVAEVVADADRDIGLQSLRWAQEHAEDCPAPTPQRLGFVGTAACAPCHPDAFAVWKTTRHPHAYEALEKKGKQYHLACIGCHVAGWQVPGGVCRVDKTENRREVTCESCHGPGSAHTVTPTKGTIRRVNSAEVCTGCHDHENSPHFAFDTYLQQIRGPGHGLPRAPDNTTADAGHR